MKKVKDYLNQVRYLEKEIDCKIKEKQKLKATLLSAATLTEDKVQTSFTNSIENTYVKIIEFDEDVNQTIDTLVNLKIRISHEIDQVDNPVSREILRHRYLFFESWEGISSIMNYSLQHIHRLHGLALVEFEDVMLCDVRR